jgi:membrane protease YdiL (CAAX protease family)
MKMYYFSPFEPTHGNLVWAVTSVITEQTVVGLLLGVVWVRTRNLTAPVLLHAFIDAIAMMSVVQIGTG